MNVYQKAKVRSEALDAWISKSPWRIIGKFLVTVWLMGWAMMFRQDAHTYKRLAEDGIISLVAYAVVTPPVMLVVPWVYFKLFPNQLPAKPPH